MVEPPGAKRGRSSCSAAAKAVGAERGAVWFRNNVLRGRLALAGHTDHRGAEACRREHTGGGCGPDPVGAAERAGPSEVVPPSRCM